MIHFIILFMLTFETTYVLALARIEFGDDLNAEFGSRKPTRKKLV
jgi:hypothetical protein